MLLEPQLCAVCVVLNVLFAADVQHFQELRLWAA